MGAGAQARVDGGDTVVWWGRNRSERVEPKTSLSGAAEHQPRRAQSKPVRQTTNPDFTELQASEERARKRLSLRLLTPSDRPTERVARWLRRRVNGLWITLSLRGSLLPLPLLRVELMRPAPHQRQQGQGDRPSRLHASQVEPSQACPDPHPTPGRPRRAAPTKGVGTRHRPGETSPHAGLHDVHVRVRDPDL